jgi:glycine/D-amino acid oxidase-like deaminating enzyme
VLRAVPASAACSGIEPEVYPRPDGSVYVCGEPQGSVPLPADPAAVSVVPERCAVLEHAAAGVSSALDGAAVEARQACYLPNTHDGAPLIGRCVRRRLGRGTCSGVHCRVHEPYNRMPCR